MEIPTMEELIETIRSLPNGKATGPLNVSNEMIKHLDQDAYKIIRLLFNIILHTEVYPPEWCYSRILPISKPKPWNLELKNTRPIILLNTMRKLLMSIFNCRLSKILKENTILKGPNFASLLGESTFEPIQLLNALTEHARDNKKQLWAFFQDTEKAFDTVNLEMLKLSLQRIKISRVIIDLIIEIYRNRKMRVYAQSGTVGLILGQDGIDQGEVISPLMWRIFYDPPLMVVSKREDLGFAMKVKWNPDLSVSQVEEVRKEELSISVSCMAYVDDTTWVSSSKDKLQEILDIAATFYKLNDSMINTLKSKLMVVNCPEHLRLVPVYAGTDKGPVYSETENNHIKFLGIYFSPKQQLQNIFKNHISETIRALHVIRKKKIMDDQIVYMIQKILIPRIKYRIQHVTLSQSQMDRLTSQYYRVIKQTLSFSRTMSNVTVASLHTYNVNMVNEIKNILHTSTVINMLNNGGVARVAALIRLKEFQLKNWIPSNILKSRLNGNPKIKNNLLAGIIIGNTKQGITVESADCDRYFEVKG